MHPGSTKISKKHCRTVKNSPYHNLSTNECLSKSYSITVVNLCIWLVWIQNFTFSQEKSYIARKENGNLLGVVRSLIIWAKHQTLDKISYNAAAYHTILICSLFYYKIIHETVSKHLKTYLDLKGNVTLEVRW